MKPAKRQHFVSQVEQRFNAIDRSLPKKQQKIHAFEIMDKERNSLRLVDSRGVRIRNNLQLPHLFTFRDSEKIARDMEALFGQFESQYTGIVQCLESELRPGGIRSVAFDDAIRIWGLKFLNTFRNPYSIRKTVDTFREPERYFPTDPTYKSWHQSIMDETDNPLFTALDDTGVTLDEFKKWQLGLLLLVMRNEAPGIGNYPYADTLMGQMAHELLTDRSRITWLVFHVLSKDFDGRFLLSDRGYTAGSAPKDKARLVLDFNLSDRIAITFCSIDPKSISFPRAPWVNDTILDAAHAELTAQSERPVVFDDSDWLANYNERTIYYAYKHVYCSREQVVGAQVQLEEPREHDNRSMLMRPGGTRDS
jgi:hypothetical protein